MPATTESIALPRGAASFPGALRDARSEASQRRVVLEATALAVALAAVYLIVSPRTADLAAHVFRAGLFEREGPSIWNAAWYGGHHLPSYSLLFPPLERCWACGWPAPCARWRRAPSSRRSPTGATAPGPGCPR